MGPRLNGRGDVDGEYRALEERHASMGPRLNGRGDLASTREDEVAWSVLQWGRD